MDKSLGLIERLIIAPSVVDFSVLQMKLPASKSFVPVKVRLLEDFYLLQADIGEGYEVNSITVSGQKEYKVSVKADMWNSQEDNLFEWLVQLDKKANFDETFAKYERGALFVAIGLNIRYRFIAHPMIKYN